MDGHRPGTSVLADEACGWPGGSPPTAGRGPREKAEPPSPGVARVLRQHLSRAGPPLPYRLVGSGAGSPSEHAVS